MKIEDKRKSRDNLTFNELYVGDVFEYGEEDADKEIFVKCGDDVALSLSDDYVEDFIGRVTVRRVNVKIVIED